MERVRLLPDDLEQQWLLEETATLIEEAGWERYVTAVLVQPDADHFPDRWTPDAVGVRLLARRLLNYAGLGELEVSVQLFQGDHDVELDTLGRVTETRRHGAAAWFAGIEDGVCIFGAEVSQFNDPLSITAAMAHEVAHVFRRVHELEDEDTDTEECLTDLTTIYLGFGLLTTNATSRHRTTGDFSIYQWSHQSLGYLPPQAMSYLLALWARARGYRERRIASALEANQAGYFRAASKKLGADLDSVVQTLGLPPREQWPAVKSVEELAVPISDEPEAFEALASEEWAAEPVVKMNTGRPVFRVKSTKRLLYGAQCGIAGMLFAVSTILAMGTINAIVIGGLLGVIAVCSLGGAVVGSVVRADYCSDPDCKHLLSADDHECPQCGGDIKGEIDHENDQLKTEETLGN